MSSAQLKNGNMPILIGQCCTDQVSGTPGSSDISAKNEIVPFEVTDLNFTDFIIQWNSTRKNKFGNAAVFQVEMYSPTEGKYILLSPVLAWPDSIANTTKYTIRIPGPGAGRIVIS